MSTTQSTPVYSSFGTDPDMLELVQEFVGALPERVAAIESAVQTEDLEALRRLAHQLKGASGGYGFEMIGQAAASLEATAKISSSVKDVCAQVQELTSLCQRAKACPD
jgi:HPt (histidine-containing phosphotransfer) domain-containing protein